MPYASDMQYEPLRNQTGHRPFVNYQLTHHAPIHVTVVGVHLVDWNRFSIFDPNFDCFLG
jgi:hypothetical protein